MSWGLIRLRARDPDRLLGLLADRDMIRRASGCRTARLFRDTADPREATPQPPLRVFAGKQIARGQYATDEFTVLQGFDKNVDYYTPRPDRGDFVLVAKYDAAGFLDVAAELQPIGGGDLAVGELGAVILPGDGARDRHSVLVE